MKEKRFSFLNFLERVGNFLPHPAVLFLVLIIALMIASAVASYFGLSVIDPRNTEKQIAIVNLISMDGFVRLTTSFVTNFSNFPPLGQVLVAMLGVGIAEHSGFLSAIIRALVIKAPKRFLTLMVVFAGILSNAAAEVGYVVLIPLAGMIFHSVGRNPLAGIAAAFAGVSGGYSANLVIGTVDPLLAGITQQAARLIDPTYVVSVESNWYFMIVSTFVVSILGYLVTEKIVEPRLEKFQSEIAVERESLHLTPIEKKGMLYAFLSFVIFIGLILICALPEGSPFRNPTTGALTNSPFFKSIIFLVFFSFAIPGIVYGIVANKFKTFNNVIKTMEEGMRTMSGYLVIIFFAAHFIALFSWSNFGPFLAINGANFLKELNLGGGFLLIGFVIISAFINLFISSASAQWAILSPVFVPLLMLLGYSPEVIQAAYRIGDSTTNIITPLLSYLPVILVAAMKYKKDFKIGTMISMMFPYTIAFLIGWCALLYLWIFVFGLPVGPGAPTFYKEAL